MARPSRKTTEAQRHRGRTQSHPSTSQTRRHEDTKAAHPTEKTADYADERRSTNPSQETQRRKDAKGLSPNRIHRAGDGRRSWRRSDDRRPPVGITSTPDASVRRRRASHRATPAISDRRPLGRDTATIACDRRGSPAQRSWAAVRRPELRHALNHCRLSAPLRYVCVFVPSCLRCGFMALCPNSVSLCLCGFSGEWAGLVLLVSWW